jgi:hypothetical protein
MEWGRPIIDYRKWKARSRVLTVAKGWPGLGLLRPRTALTD